MSEHRTRSDDRGSGECLADCVLTGCLGTIKLGRRGWRSVEVRNVDQPGNANARGDFGDTPSAVGVYIVKGEVPLNGERRVQGSAIVAVALKRKKKWIRRTLSRNHGLRDCTRCRSAGHILRSVPRCGCPIPAKNK